MSNYKEVEIEILDKKYKYKVDEPEEVVNEILQDIKRQVEDYAESFGKIYIEKILLLLLLNEKLHTKKIFNNIEGLIEKYNKEIEGVNDINIIKN